ncbi:MAG: hypothetical protein K2Z81_20390, partial [Cyanobacteria bacterium]|nr:hypothetical protein [Cyanobacteriota bacterium]
MKPDRKAFTRPEWQVVEKYRTPRQVQQYLRSLPYNREHTQRSFRGVIQSGSAHCLEGALTAAAILEQHGYPPLVVSFESIDQLDHVIFVFKSESGWGSVARSRDMGLHGRKPIFRSVRDLALSYFDPYVDFTGRITGYALVDLDEVDHCDWRFSSRNLWKLEKYLIDFPHDPIVVSNNRYLKLRKQYEEFRARYPKRQATY